MLKIEEKEYDLNFLFQFSFDFQMLKEILIKLAKSNQDLESRVKNLKKKAIYLQEKMMKMQIVYWVMNRIKMKKKKMKIMKIMKIIMR